MKKRVFDFAFVCVLATATPITDAIAQSPTDKRQTLSEAEIAKRRAISATNLKVLTWAIENYRDLRGRFPGSSVPGNGDKARLSWRVMALASLNQNELFYHFHLDEPWDSEHNLKLVDKMPAIYRDPFDDRASTSPAYFMLVGKGTFGASFEGVRAQDITDGRSQTITIVEGKRNIPWTKPEDIEVDVAANKPLSELGLYGPSESFLAAFADGGVRQVSKKAPASTLHALLTLAGGETIAVETLDQFVKPIATEDKVVSAALDAGLIERLTASVPRRPQPPPEPIDRTKLSFKAQAALDRKQSRANFETIAKGVFEYASSKKSFPPRAKFDKDGKPLLSWRVLILPYINEYKLYEQFDLDQPWDSPRNLPLATRMPAFYSDPSIKNAVGTTVFQAVVGPGLAFDGTSGLRIKQIIDGASGTIAMVEVDSELAVPWTKPADWEYDSNDPLKGLAKAPLNSTFQRSSATDTLEHLSTRSILQRLKQC